jgi:hypothetical protein
MEVALLTIKSFHLLFSTRALLALDQPLPVKPEATLNNSPRLSRTSSQAEVEEVSLDLPDNSKLWMMITPNL